MQDDDGEDYQPGRHDAGRVRATTAATIMTIAVTETSGSILTAFCVVSLKNLLIMKPAPIGRMTTCTIEMNIDIMSTLTVSLRSR